MSQPRKEIWGSIDEAGRHLGKDYDAIVQRMKASRAPLVEGWLAISRSWN
jgi:hypothetical protein